MLGHSDDGVWVPDIVCAGAEGERLESGMGFRRLKKEMHLSALIGGRGYGTRIRDG
jgi:hypothetical protein